MRSRPRIRKIVKWGGFFFGTALLAITIWSSGWNCEWAWASVTQLRMLDVGEGRVLFKTVTYDPGKRGVDGYTSFERTRIVPRYVQWWFSPGRGRYDLRIEVPLWMPTLALLGASTFAWRFDILARRRAITGKCNACGYDLAGLGSAAACPECGKVA